VNTVMKPGSIKTGNFLTSWVIISFSVSQSGSPSPSYMSVIWCECMIYTSYSYMRVYPKVSGLSWQRNKQHQ
jgi:hypothetical protein